MANRFFREFNKDRSSKPGRPAEGGAKISQPVVEKTSFPSAELPGRTQRDRSLGVKKVKVSAMSKGF